VRADLLQTNFSGGELSPRLYGRVDLAKYNDAVKSARDVVLLQHGGARSRPGWDWLGEVKDSTKATRLIPFVFSQTDAFIIEAGDGYMRFWKDGVLLGGPYEVTTPYTTATIFDVDYAQGADTMFLALQSVAPHRLQRFADTRWVLDAAPFDPMPFDEIGMRQATVVTLGSAGLGATTATGAAAVWLASDVGREITYSGGVATITGFTSTTVVNVNVTVPFAGTTLPASQWVLLGSPQTTCTPSAKDPIGATITLTLAADGWRSADVGKFVQINGGLCKITVYTSALVVSARIESELTATVAAEADSWSLESSVWNTNDGYPRTMSLHQQRLVAAGSPKYPQTIWGSRSGLYLDFTKGTLDDDSYSFELGSDEINPIQFLSSNRDLMALTYGGEWTLSGGIEKPITPTNVRAQPQAKAGSTDVRPEQVDDDLYYVQRGVSALRTLGYSVELGGYKSEEAGTLSEHLPKGGIGAISYAQSPERVLWSHKTDGSYLALTISREQTIRAFASCSTDGVVESIATIPEGGEDRTYAVIRRTINGTPRRYVERMNWSAYQDCRLTLSPGSATVTNLNHLAGKTVSAVADGVDLGDFVVSAGGEITLPRAAATVTVGLRFTPTIKLLPTEFSTGMGAASGKRVHNGKTMVLFSETVGCNVNGQPLAFREFGEGILDQPVDPFSGWKDVSDLGWDVDAGEVELTQPQSYPWCILSVVRRMTANPG
jgi:hypothetical protein